MKKLSKEILQGMNKKQLYDYCRSNKIKGYSNRNKAYIVNLILNFYKPRIICDRCRTIYVSPEQADFTYATNRVGKVKQICGMCTMNFDIIFEKDGELFYNGK